MSDLLVIIMNSIKIHLFLWVSFNITENYFKRGGIQASFWRVAPETSILGEI